MTPARSMASAVLVTVVAAVLATAGACLDHDVHTITEGVIIGDNDLLPVAADGGNLPARYRASLDAIGKLVIPIGGGGAVVCTATHVGNSLVVTAGHCLDAPPVRTEGAACDGVRVEWGRRAGRAPVLRSSCTGVVAMETNRDRDYAFFRVDAPPPAAIPVDLSMPAPGTRLTIFSHPGGRPLEWSRTCPLVAAGGDQLGYPCDTQGGSSGAAVLRDDSLAVVGIHWGGGGSRNAATVLGGTAVDVLTAGTRIRAATDPAFCLDVEVADAGGDLLAWGCHGDDTQRWIHARGQLRVHADRCLAVERGVLALRACTGGDDRQQWRRSGERVRWAGGDLCLALGAERPDGGYAVGLRDCNSAPAQRWRWAP